MLLRQSDGGNPCKLPLSCLQAHSCSQTHLCLQRLTLARQDKHRPWIRVTQKSHRAFEDQERIALELLELHAGIATVVPCSCVCRRWRLVHVRQISPFCLQATPWMRARWQPSTGTGPMMLLFWTLWWCLAGFRGVWSPHHRQVASQTR